MLLCPFCGQENIDGADVCDECQQPLAFLSKPRPSSAMERSLIKDRVSMLSPRPAVVVEDDPAVEFHEWYGRYSYFRPSEVEPLMESSPSKPPT